MISESLVFGTQIAAMGEFQRKGGLPDPEWCSGDGVFAPLAGGCGESAFEVGVGTFGDLVGEPFTTVGVTSASLAAE